MLLPSDIHVAARFGATMMMRTRIMRNVSPVIAALAAAVLALCFAACERDAVYTIRVGVSTVPTEPPSIALKRFAKLVGERSDNKIKVEVYEGGVLGMDRDLIEGVLLGTVQMHMAANSPLASFVPELMIFEMPFLFKDNEHFDAVMDSQLAWEYASALEEKGFHLLGFWSHGVRHILTPALETGAIDGAEAANSNYYGNRLYEVAKNWAQVGWLHLVAPLVMSKTYYDNLPADLQKILDDTGREVGAFERALYVKRDKELLSQLQADGVNVTYPDREPFIEAAKAVYDQWADKVGGSEKIQAIIDFEY
jgi:TRAP-type C4-dicarboxylate transport system substrate-binding protein